MMFLGFAMRFERWISLPKNAKRRTSVYRLASAVLASDIFEREIQHSALDRALRKESPRAQLKVLFELTGMFS